MSLHFIGRPEGKACKYNNSTAQEHEGVTSTAYMDPINYERLEGPVIALNGHCYDGADTSIKGHFRGKSAPYVDPFRNDVSPFDVARLYHAHVVRSEDGNVGWKETGFEPALWRHECAKLSKMFDDVHTRYVDENADVDDDDKGELDELHIETGGGKWWSLSISRRDKGHLYSLYTGDTSDEFECVGQVGADQLAPFFCSIMTPEYSFIFEDIRDRKSKHRPTCHFGEEGFDPFVKLNPNDTSAIVDILIYVVQACDTYLAAGR